MALLPSNWLQKYNLFFNKLHVSAVIYDTPTAQIYTVDIDSLIGQSTNPDDEEEEETT